PGALQRMQHGTSFRQLPGRLMTTWVAVIAPPIGDWVPDVWPQALPILRDVVEEVGPARPHHPNRMPTPDDFHTLLHAVRLLRFEYDTNPNHRARMGAMWGRALEPLRPALAGLFTAPYPEVA